MNGVLTFKVPAEKMAEAARVASNVALTSIFLRRVEAVNAAGPVNAKPACECRVMHRMLGFSIPSDGRLLIETEAKVELLPINEGCGEPDKAQNPVVSIAVAYANEYSVPEGPIPDDVKKSLASFAELNGLFNAWPFLRQQIHSLSSEMNYPITLPTLRIVPHEKGKAKKAVRKADKADT